MYIRLKWPALHPESNHRYGVDWKDFLANLGDTAISTSAWELPAGGPVMSGGDEGTITTDGARTTFVRLTGGTEQAQAYEVKNTITTPEGNTWVAICEIIIAT
jgi:hypothetical protein